MVLVVNATRIDSLTIANHFAHLRQIPASNILFLDYEGSTEVLPVEQLRSEILKPIFNEIAKRRLTDQIDAIVYSSGFPYAIDFRSDLDLAPGTPAPPTTGTRGSLTGLTYLSRMVLKRDTNYLFTLQDMRNNYYQARDTRGFRSSYKWAPTGERTTGNGRQYYLSMILGYTDGSRGNSVNEVVSYLRRSAVADGSRPSGTIYFMSNANVRSTTRKSNFVPTATKLTEMGIAARVIEGVLPTGQKDIMGAVLGHELLQWGAAKCELLPGSIVEHLTSFGGDLRAEAGQTPFTETLRLGAAGSSGTVTEPFAIPSKFPHPWMHVHYARGSSLIEAFYQSVGSPYQLLIAGDPLCRPWANIPKVAVDGVRPGQTVAGVLEITPRPASIVPVSEFRLYFDGRLITSCAPGEKFELDSTKVADGYHELRVVAVEDSPIESLGRLLVPVTVDNESRTIQVTASPNISSLDKQVHLHITSAGAQNIYLFHNRHAVGKINGQSGTLAVGPEVVGRGPVTLMAVAQKGKTRVFSEPVAVTISDEEVTSFGNRRIPLGSIPPIGPQIGQPANQ